MQSVRRATKIKYVCVTGKGGAMVENGRVMVECSRGLVARLWSVAKPWQSILIDKICLSILYSVEPL